MATQTLTFPCPFCGRRMGVGIELLGRHVRCPHCKQVVLAPSTAGTSPAPPAAPPPTPASVPSPLGTGSPPAAPKPVAPKPAAPKPPPPAPAPPPEPEPANPFAFGTTSPPTAPRPDSPPAPPGDPEPVFTFPQRKEAADSILGDEQESDDEVFSSQKGYKLPIPIVPESPPPPTEPLPSPPEFPPTEIPTIELQAHLGLPPDPVPAPHQPTPPTMAGPVVVQPTPSPTAAANPFAFEPVPPAPAPVAPKSKPPTPMPIPPTPVAAEPLPIEELPEDEPVPKPTRVVRSRAAASAEGGNGFKTLVFILAPYAAVVTALAVYGLFFKSTEKIDPGHPLSTIPDNFGEFDPASRKKTTQLKVDVDAPLPGHLKVGLAKRIEVGQLEIEPVAVVVRNLEIIEESKTAGRSPRPDKNATALVLHLRVKNTSSDLSIHPLDPAFNRKTGVDKIGTQLVVGKRRFYGGPIVWPFPSHVKRVYDAQQEHDATPLAPGDTREYVVCSDIDPNIRRAVRDSNEPIEWRVQVRRGLVNLKGKEVPVTAIIGVEFKAADVRNLN
jgi:hypothetical protein